MMYENNGLQTNMCDASIAVCHKFWMNLAYQRITLLLCCGLTQLGRMLKRYQNRVPDFSLIENIIQEVLSWHIITSQLELFFKCEEKSLSLIGQGWNWTRLDVGHVSLIFFSQDAFIISNRSNLNRNWTVPKPHHMQLS